jgi:hypothetical protein
MLLSLKLAAVGLGEDGKMPVSQFSKGMKNRLIALIDTPRELKSGYGGPTAQVGEVTSG